MGDNIVRKRHHAANALRDVRPYTCYVRGCRSLTTCGGHTSSWISTRVVAMVRALVCAFNLFFPPSQRRYRWRTCRFSRDSGSSIFETVHVCALLDLERLENRAYDSRTTVGRRVRLHSAHKVGAGLNSGKLHALFRHGEMGTPRAKSLDAAAIKTCLKTCLPILKRLL